ncbi:MAG: VCBS repeat-containing protein [Myxococcota bacterium]
MRRFLVLLAMPLAACGSESDVCGDGLSVPGQLCLEAREAGSDILLAIGDANGDGRADALTLVSQDPPRVGIQLGQADGTFAPAATSMAIDQVPYAATIDRSGFLPEVLLWGHADNRQQVCAFEVDRGGGFTATWCHELSDITPLGHRPYFETGRFGDDGEPGFAVQGLDEVVVVIDPAGIPTERYMPWTFSPNGSAQVLKADLDCDGRDELLWAAESGEVLKYSAPWQDPFALTEPEPTTMWVGDFDGDGFHDLATQRREGDQLELQIRTGHGADATLTFDADGNWSRAHVADLDADGRDDLLFVSDEGSSVQWGHSLFDANPGNAEFIGSPWDLDSVDVLTSDVNGDGADDLLLVRGSDTYVSDLLPSWVVEIWVNDP